MAQLLLFALTFVLATLSNVSTEDTCAWPDFLDISVKNGTQFEDLEINSWETNIKIKKKHPKINGIMKQNMWLTVLNNDTIEVTYDTRKRNVQNKQRLFYICTKELEDFTYAVKVSRGRLDENDTFVEMGRPEYMCVQFIQRSMFVLQWRVGPKTEEIPDCGNAFAPIKPWPLIHLPFRKFPIWDNLQEKHGDSLKLLKQYQSCPDLGGYQMRVFDKEGNPVNGECKNDDPSPRLESECLHGDGVRIIQAQNCTAYSELGLGSKLNCLATWEDGRYEFSVLVPAYGSGINSFHCLRLNKQDPTKERATLFLDTICGKGEVVKKKVNNFQIELRRSSINAICDDTSDQCDAEQCESMTHSCLTTCNACPANETITIDESLHGVWLLQQRGEGRTPNITITENSIELFDVGTFHAYSNGSSEMEQCLEDSLTASENENVLKYLLGGVPNNPGCGPRVTTIRAKKVNDAVMLAQIPAPAPLRANMDNTRLDSWCRNNYDDVNTFGQLFSPLYPFQSASGGFQNTSGYVTLINAEVKEPVECMIQETLKDVMVAASLKSDTGYQSCQGNIKTGDENKNWHLKFNCADDDTTDVQFSCLGRYDIDSDHYAVILDVAERNSIGSLPLEEEYYCIILPMNASENSTIIFNHAGECDIVHKSLTTKNIIEPSLTLTVGGKGTAATSKLQTLWLLFYFVIHVTLATV